MGLFSNDMYGYDDTATTRVPDGEDDYLAKAAEQLGKAAARIDRAESRSVSTLYIDQRQQLADRYAVLGAIQRGQMPASLARELYERLAADAR